MDTPDSTTSKRCSKCGVVKPRDQFSKNKSRKDGLSGECKECQSAYYKLYYAKNHDVLLEYQKQYNASNKDKVRDYHRQNYLKNREQRLDVARKRRIDNREHLIEYQSKYREKNREAKRERDRLYRDSNRELLNAKARERYKKNPTAFHAREHRRRAHRIGNGGEYSAADLAAIRAAQTDKQGRLICWACNKPIVGTAHLDHWIPLDKGGPNDAGNLHYMHAKCNLSKGRKHPTEIGRLL